MRSNIWELESAFFPKTALADQIRRRAARLPKIGVDYDVINKSRADLGRARQTHSRKLPSRELSPLIAGRATFFMRRHGD